MMKRFPGKKPSRILLGLVAVALCLVLPAGCGKKGPPKLPDVTPPPSVTNLAVTLEGGDVVLRWTATVAKDEAHMTEGYLIYRSAEPVSEEACAGCPVLFQRAAKIPLAEAVAASNEMVYREALLPATRYRFKVVPYDTQGQLGPNSNIVRIVTD
jgi:predicted small lipoprotein YifL